MVKGLDTFAEFFAGDEGHYVLIGGVATQLTLEDAGLPARATKDLDIVLCIEALNARFGERLWAFIEAGGYELRQQGQEPRCFYRFAKPAAENFPVMLEFFARAPGRLPLAEGAHLTPVPIDDAVQSLSAILLDDDYYGFLHAHTRKLAGLRIITERALIPLKARAWLDLNQRQQQGEGQVDSRSLKKHLRDVVTLSQLLTDGEPVAAPSAILDDMRRFLEAAIPVLTPEMLQGWQTEDSIESIRSRLQAAYGAAP